MGRFRSTSSLVGFASSFFHVSRYFGSCSASPPNSSTGERTGQNSQNITSGFLGHLDLSAMYGCMYSTPLRRLFPSGVENSHRLSSGVEAIHASVAIASALKIEYPYG